MDTIRRTRLDKMLDIVNLLLVIAIVFVIVYPLVFVVSASLSDPNTIYENPFVLWPQEITFASYENVFQNPDIWLGFRNSILYTLIGTTINIALSIMAAYPLSRKDFYGKSFFTLLFVITMFFQGGLIPLYLVNQSLGILDSMWVMVLPTAISVFNVIIIRTYFQTTIPSELEDSAKVDGCNDLHLLYKIVLPLSVPIIAVMVLFYGVFHWNSYFNALVFLSSRELFPLQLFLREILVQNQLTSMMDSLAMVDDQYAERLAVMEGIKYAVVVVSSLPILIIYPMLQRFFVKGILIGSIKG